MMGMTTLTDSTERVKLITITPDAEQIIAYCARVSSNNQDNPNIAKLIKYCMAHGHWSILEQANMTLEVNTTRSISAQILRHGFRPQEFSQRYQKVNIIEDPKQRRQDDKNRQNSFDDLSDEDLAWYNARWANLKDEIMSFYNDMLDRGFAKETARQILPMCSRTRLYLNGNIRTWYHYIEVRTKDDTQLEHREIAEECKRIFIEQLPIVASAAGWTDVNQ